MDKEITDLQYEYLKDVLNELSGIGEARAARIICTQTTFSDFENIQKQTLTQIRGITSEKSQEITERFNRIDFSRSARILYTEKVLKSFVDTQYEKVENIDLDDLNINVLLIKALGFTTVEETIEFYIYQRITRSVVTSWGSKALEEICMISGAEDISSSENVKVQGKKFDMKIEKNEKKHYVQLKSGPNTMNVGMVDSLNNMIDEIEKKNSNAVGMLGMAYGKESQISSQIKGNLNDFNKKAVIGEEFWEFLTDQDDYYADLIELITALSEEYEEQYDDDYLDVVEQQKQKLVEEWENRYGGEDDGSLSDFVGELTKR